MTITAYQTLEDRGNIDFVIANAPFECNRSGAWLGHGYYFWDTNIDWAYSWGKNSYENKGKASIIGECQLNLNGTCFNLVGSVVHQLAFQEVLELFKRHPKSKSIGDLNVPNIITFMKNKGLFNYKSIRASDMGFKDRVKLFYTQRRKEYTILNPRIQICVIESNGVFSPPFKIVYPN